MPRPSRASALRGISAGSVRHLLEKHAATFNELDWVDEVMPFTARFFDRPWRILHNIKEGKLGYLSSFEQSTYGTRDHSSLDFGLRLPPVRGQAVIYDPTGRDLLEKEYLCVDDAIMNVAFDEYGEGGAPFTNQRLDRIARQCQSYVKLNMKYY